ncbi:MAG: hypothetical protein L3V56_00470 [Candidatus Magnetoovum sp. WYHC-5]|nr:hypothetical protein [Candidatus Magnetoovum sp. WYHC-5]
MGVSGISSQSVFIPTTRYGSNSSVNYRLHDSTKSSVIGTIDKATFNSMFGADGIDANEWSSGVGLSKYLFEALAGVDGKISWDEVYSKSLANMADSGSTQEVVLTNHDLAFDSQYVAAEDELSSQDDLIDSTDGDTPSANESTTAPMDRVMDSILEYAKELGKAPDSFIEVAKQTGNEINEEKSIAGDDLSVVRARVNFLLDNYRQVAQGTTNGFSNGYIDLVA